MNSGEGTYLAVLNDTLSKTRITGGHEGEHDGDVCHCVCEDVGGEAELYAALGDGREVDVVWRELVSREEVT